MESRVTDQLSMFAPPGRTDTSKAAAEKIKPHASNLRAEALIAIRLTRQDGITTSALAEWMGIDYASIQPRTSELRKADLIVDSGRRGKNAKGNLEIIWIAKEFA